jgi:FlaA1/EpsC-like NDP-sugar epimerase
MRPGGAPRARYTCNRAPKGTEMMLKDKVAVIYGAGGSVGGAVARAFAA